MAAVAAILVAGSALGAAEPAGARERPAGTSGPVAAGGQGAGRRPPDVIFASNAGGDHDLLRWSASRKKAVTALTRGPAEDLDPAADRSGRWVAFARVRPGGTSARIHVLRANGAGLRRLPTTGMFSDREPSWAPGARRIVFVRSRPLAGTARLFWRRVAGRTRPHRITSTPPGRYDATPAWAPRGGRIAFSSDRAGGLPEIYTVGPDGSGLRRLTRNGLIDTKPSWSPDGRMLVFERCCPGGDSEIVRMRADGRGERVLTRTAAHEVQPSWSPDGRSVVFTRIPRGGGDPKLGMVSAAGGRTRVLVSRRGANLSPAAVPRPRSRRKSGVWLHHEERHRARRPARERKERRRRGRPGRPRMEGPVSRSSRRVAPGVRLVRIVHHRGPIRVFALRVDLRKRARMDVALARNRLPGLETTSSMARRAGAVAAVNGDFALPGGRPVGTIAVDGVLMQASLHGANVAVARTEERAFVDQRRPRLSALEGRTARLWLSGRQNAGPPVYGEVNAVTRAAGGLEGVPARSCSARLRPAGRPEWSRRRRGVVRRHVVEAVRCGAPAMGRRGRTVISTDPGSMESVHIRSLRRGERVWLRWSMGWPGVVETVAGFPMIVGGAGSVVPRGCRISLCRAHPRTGVGVTRRGELLLVVVDGRRPGWSVGMTLQRFAREMRWLGAVRALNLDGGGSSTMVVRGRIVNRPSDGAERGVSSAVLVLGGRDRSERIRRAPPETRRRGDRNRRPEGEDPTLLDPGSTAGLVEALVRGPLRVPGAPPLPAVRDLARRMGLLAAAARP